MGFSLVLDFDEVKQTISIPTVIAMLVNTAHIIINMVDGSRHEQNLFL
jgi:hypothetical protein